MRYMFWLVLPFPNLHIVAVTFLGDLVDGSNLREQIAEFFTPLHAKGVADFIGNDIFLFHAFVVLFKDLRLAFADFSAMLGYKLLEMSHSVHGK